MAEGKSLPNFLFKLNRGRLHQLAPTSPAYNWQTLAFRPV